MQWVIASHIQSQKVVGCDANAVIEHLSMYNVQKDTESLLKMRSPSRLLKLVEHSVEVDGSKICNKVSVFEQEGKLKQMKTVRALFPVKKGDRLFGRIDMFVEIGNTEHFLPQIQDCHVRI